jgi:hypothetical protein
MTDDEWLACESPARMRAEIRPRPFPGACWVLFDLACIQRVRDLLGPHALQWVDAVAGRDDLTLRHTNPGRTQSAAVHDEARALWLQRTDPLHKAKLAAAGAVGAIGSYTLQTSEMVCVAAGRRVGQPGLLEAVAAERQVHATLMRCVFRSTLAPVAFSAAWRTDTAVALATQMCLWRDYSAMPILADALQDAGCTDERVLAHCRCAGPHARGCWVVDLVLGTS